MRLPKRFMDGRVIRIMKFNRKLKNNSKKESFVNHFRLLGLRRGECRTNVIRSAAQAMSVALNYGVNPSVGDHRQHSSDDVRRAKIALAAYRLLDPRERADIYERVQLCYPIDRDDFELPLSSAATLVDQMPKVPAMRRPSNPRVALMGQPLIDEAIEGKSPTDEEPGADTPLSSYDPSSSEPSMEERRNIVRLLRNSEEATLRGLSPLGWLRSRLGI
jgi:hypothetical protein